MADPVVPVHESGLRRQRALEPLTYETIQGRTEALNEGKKTEDLITGTRQVGILRRSEILPRRVTVFANR